LITRLQREVNTCMGTKYSNITLHKVKQDELLEYLAEINHNAYVSPTINHFTTLYDLASEQPLSSEDAYELYETALANYPASMLETVKSAISIARSQTAKLTKQNAQISAILECYGDTEEASLVSLTSHLTAQFSCSALAVFLRGDTEMWYHLNQDGEMIDEYTTYAENDWQPGKGIFTLAGQQIKGGNAQRLCAAFGREEVVEQVERILRKPADPINWNPIHNSFDYETLLQLPSFPDAITRHRALAIALKMQPCWVTYLSYATARQGLLDHFAGDPEAPPKENALNMLKKTTFAV